MRESGGDRISTITLNLFQGLFPRIARLLMGRWMLKQVQHDEEGCFLVCEWLIGETQKQHGLWSRYAPQAVKGCEFSGG
jgi:hypothetical protein